jgi:hypothetical protein
MGALTIKSDTFRNSLNVKINQDYCVSVHFRNNEAIFARYNRDSNRIDLLDREEVTTAADCKIIINADLEQIKQNMKSGGTALSGTDIQFMKKPGEDISLAVLVLKSLSKKLLSS